MQSCPGGLTSYTNTAEQGKDLDKCHLIAWWFVYISLRAWIWFRPLNPHLLISVLHKEVTNSEIQLRSEAEGVYTLILPIRLTLCLKQCKYQSSHDQGLTFFSNTWSCLICHWFTQEGNCLFLGVALVIDFDYVTYFQNAILWLHSEYFQIATATLKSISETNIKNDFLHNSCPSETTSYSTGEPTSHAFYITFSFP